MQEINKQEIIRNHYSLMGKKRWIGKTPEEISIEMKRIRAIGIQNRWHNLTKKERKEKSRKMNEIKKQLKQSAEQGEILKN